VDGGGKGMKSPNDNSDLSDLEIVANGYVTKRSYFIQMIEM
jgi:hypothetical protein